MTRKIAVNTLVASYSLPVSYALSHPLLFCAVRLVHLFTQAHFIFSSIKGVLA